MLKVKRDAEGEIERYKARLCAQGFSQRRGIDYFETFAPVMTKETLRVLVALANERDLECHTVDISTAFLHGELEEEIYMKQPPGFVTPGEEHKVCRLLKGLYGLKQSSRAWNTRLKGELQNLGFVRTETDHCLYIKGTGDDLMALGVHVDDICAIGSGAALEEFKAQLREVFELTDGGPISFFLGLQFYRDRANRKLLINQTRFITDIIANQQLDGCAHKKTPWESTVTLTKAMSPQNDEEREEMRSVPYREAVGELMYVLNTRPDIAQAVSQVARFTSNPGKAHWSAVKRIYRYLSGTLTLGICFDGNVPLQLEGYADADWAGQEERRSTTGYVFTFGGGLIAWRSQRQQTVALSTMEAEYMSLAAATQQAVFLRALLGEFGLLREHEPTRIHEDNQACIKFGSDPVGHTRAKHIDIKYHFVREKILAGDIRLDYCHTSEMIADALTKPITANQFESLVRMMGMRTLADFAN
jgi:hypothetical protein